MPFDPTGSGTVSPMGGVTALKVGDQVDQYEVLELLATGSLASLFRGRDPVLNRLVVIKQIHLTGTAEDDQIRKRVRQTAEQQKRLAQANDEHLVQIFDVIDEQRGLFLISELVDGPSLDEILSRDGEPLDRKQVLGIMAAVSIALGQLHQAGVIHKDLQPANILLPRTGGLKVADVGLAPAIDPQHSLGAQTVRYMSPEMLRGEAVDGRSDLYSLGMMAYEMFAGRKRFAEAFKTVMRDERNQAMRWVKWHTNSRTQAPPLHEIVPELPEKYDELVNRLLEKAPTARIGSSAELLTVIRRHFIESAEEAAELDRAMGREESAGEGEPETPAAPGHTTYVPQPSKLPLILSGMLLFWVLVGGGVAVKMLMDRQAELEAERAAAYATLQDAAAELDARRWEQAEDLYAQIAGNWPADSEYGQWARAGQQFARAAAELEAGNYNDARAKLRELHLQEAVKPADERSIRAERLLPVYLRARREGSFNAGLEQIEALIDQQQYDEARDRLREWKRYTEMPVIPIEQATGVDLQVESALDAERQQINDLMVLVADRERREQDMQTVRRARELAENNQREEAIFVLNEALDKGRSSTLLTKLRDELVAERDLERYLIEAESAEATGNLDKAIEALEQASAIRETEQVDQRLSRLIARREVMRARRAIAEEDTETAEAALLVALSRDPDNQEAKDLLGTIESTNRKQALVRAARRAESEGDYESALRSYIEALKLGPDESITAAMRKINVRLNVDRAEEAMRAGQLAKAREHIQKARDLEPRDPAVYAVLEELKTLEDYQRFLTLGDDAREKSDFGEAKYYYRQAREVLDTPEIRKRLDNAEYDSLIAKAQAYIAEEDYVSAKAMAMLAHKLRATPETRQMLDMLARFTPSLADEEEEDEGAGEDEAPAEDEDGGSAPGESDDAPLPE